MNILENIRVFDNVFDIFNAGRPIGSTYTQYPGQKSPNELWEGTVWEIVKYNNVSFRSSGGHADEFERLLNISTQSGTSITFTSPHNLIKGSTLYDFINNESRIVSSVTNANTVIINRAFTYTTSTQLLASQKDTLKLHNHSFNHGHGASSSTSVSCSISASILVGYVSSDSNRSHWNAAGPNQCPPVDWTSGYFSINYSCSASSSTTIEGYNGNTGDSGGIDTHPRQFPCIVWRRKQ